ncbi:MAG: fumarylacetoacetase [Planctomycetota bacterium]|nr:fumarylacetoacetase [Planctomycetota bacterium]
MSAPQSWVTSANVSSTQFGLSNLPIGSFAAEGRGRRLGLRIGEEVIDLFRAAEGGVFSSLDAKIRDALTKPVLNDLLALGETAWDQAWNHFAAILSSDNATLRDHHERASIMMPQWGVSMRLPSDVGDYTDFYASLHHATNVGTMFRPDNPLLPNWKHLPIAYHGRSSSLVPTGTSVRRPCGQRKPTDAPPVFGPSQSMDHELEMGFLIGPGNRLGDRLTPEQASKHIFGFVLVNDWSARDIQSWEYQPLGPFLGKNFATTVGGWVVPMRSLQNARCAAPRRGNGDPQLLPYLAWDGDFGLNIAVSLHIQSAKMRELTIAPMCVSECNVSELFWTPSQMVAHHTSGGCPLRPGDLLASGTISGPTKESRGCMLERTWRGTEPIALPDGTERKFLLDGDEVFLSAHAQGRDGSRIGFGECRGVITPAVE